VTEASYDVRIWQIQERADANARYRVRWKVASRRFTKGFALKALADAFRAQLLEAARKGESFSIEAGLPQSLARRERHVTCFEHAAEFVTTTWPSAAAKSRISVLETLSVALPVLTRDLAGAPDPDVLRLAIRHAFNRNEHARGPDVAELRALGWLKRASLPVSSLEDPEVAFGLLDVLGRKLNGSPASPDYYSRRRRVMHNDLRHSGITWRLNSGVPATEIAAWAGHSVEMLMRVYARCVAGMEDVWIARMEATLRPPDGTPEGHRERGEPSALADDSHDVEG
jgi:hypothetical protein